jgi:hypothetical protein
MILKFKKSKDNNPARSFGIIYDINSDDGIILNENLFYIYKYKFCDKLLNRHIQNFIFESEIYILFGNGLYYFNNKKNLYSDEKIELLFKRFILSEDKKFKSIKKEIQYYEKSQVKTRSREPIPEDVRFEVWRRDEGKCVECGSKNNLEFDHIIPFSLGGSNTARNLQLLCEECNRKKSNKI